MDLIILLFKFALAGSWGIFNEMLLVLYAAINIESRKELFKKNLNDHYIHKTEIQVLSYAAFCGFMFVVL